MMSASSFNRVIASLAVGAGLATEIGRLSFLDVLAERRISAKPELAARAFRWLDRAIEIEKVLFDFYQIEVGDAVGRSSIVAKTLPDLMSNDGIERAALAKLIRKLVASFRSEVRDANAVARGDILMQVPAHLASRLLDDTASERMDEESGDFEWIRPAGVERVVKCPSQGQVDPIFVPTESFLNMNITEGGEDLAESVSYLWNLAMREAFAGDLCILCLAEYDGLPTQFYWDMGKQCTDECRHANFFLRWALDSLASINAGSRHSSGLAAVAAAWRESGSGLPIPREAAFFEAFWSAPLEHRLVLMQLDTEGPGVGNLRRYSATPFVRERREFADLLDIVVRDEVTHAKLGQRWLKFLSPDESSRRSVIEDARLLRGVLVMSAVAHNGDCGLLEMLAETP